MSAPSGPGRDPATHRRAGHAGTERPQHPAVAWRVDGRPPRAVRRPLPPARRRRPRRPQPRDQLRCRPAPRPGRGRCAGLAPRGDGSPTATDPTCWPADPVARGLRLATAQPSWSTPSSERCTDRRRFTSWPVPDERLTHLAAQATAWGARALPLTDVSERFRAELLINRAVTCRQRRRRRHEEQRRWIDHSARRRRPRRGAAGARRASARATQPVRGPGCSTTSRRARSRASDGLIVICAPQRRPAGLAERPARHSARCGCTPPRDGLSVVPLSQVVEVPETRDALQLEVLGGLARP